MPVDNGVSGSNSQVHAHICKACHNQTEIVGYLEQSKTVFYEGLMSGIFM